ncbi:MAG: hypothetical protein SNJ67_10380 [Chloracidobacterium sp.]|uniref:Uncharacterized protein n=1 Tax=Chloracidobacterium validum TaxID=2821543 RepID=A0ABX8BEF5_9BACT|nr:hypothetical protein [Chloracidobacterium validum]QUW03450.1 hypothetical protein J8C06_03150 [Chloracidobacterium validum]
MPVNPVDAKKLATEKNTTDLRQMLEQSDELMRVVMEKGDMETAEKAAQEAAAAAAALIVRKQGGVRELAKRVRERVAGEKDDAEDENTQPTTGDAGQ